MLVWLGQFLLPVPRGSRTPRLAKGERPLHIGCVNTALSLSTTGKHACKTAVVDTFVALGGIMGQPLHDPSGLRLFVGLIHWPHAQGNWSTGIGSRRYRSQQNLNFSMTLWRSKSSIRCGGTSTISTRRPLARQPPRRRCKRATLYSERVGFNVCIGARAGSQTRGTTAPPRRNGASTSPRRRRNGDRVRSHR